MSLVTQAILIGFTLLACAIGAGFTLGGACGLAADDPADRPIAAACGGLGIIIFVMGMACLARVIA